MCVCVLCPVCCIYFWQVNTTCVQLYSCSQKLFHIICEIIHLWQMNFVTIEHFRILSSRCEFVTLENDFTWHDFNYSNWRYV